MSSASTLLRESRIAAGITQTELGARLGISQPAVAALERPGANPRIDTLERAIAATGHKLQMVAPNWGHSVDASLVRRHLEVPIGERIEGIDDMQGFVRVLGRAKKVTRDAR